MKTEQNGFIICPKCGKKTKVKVNSDTILIRFPLYCTWCKQETIVSTK